MKKCIVLLLFTLSLSMTIVGSATAEQPGIRCVQNQLNALGFNAGPADGAIGKKTRQAAEDYRAWMSGGAGGAGWSQPALTALNGEFWCKQVADAHADVAKFVTAAAPTVQYAETARDGLVATFNVALPGKIVGWELDFKFTTECENDHRAVIKSPSGRSMTLMERGLGRCSGKPETFTSDNKDGSAFAGTKAQGKWQFSFQDLDKNFHSGVLNSARMKVSVENKGAVTDQIIVFNALPKQIPNPV